MMRATPEMRRDSAAAWAVFPIMSTVTSRTTFSRCTASPKNFSYSRSRCTMGKLEMRSTGTEEDKKQGIIASKDGTSATHIWNAERLDTEHLLSAVKFDEKGLIPAIAQQWDTGEVLMMAWMNAESLRETMKGGRVVYWSRSRQQLWRKGDTSGQVQMLHDLILDCDEDSILLKVDQRGVACHTGRRSCFYTAFRLPLGEATIISDILIDPDQLYKTDPK